MGTTKRTFIAAHAVPAGPVTNESKVGQVKAYLNATQNPKNPFYDATQVVNDLNGPRQMIDEAS